MPKQPLSTALAELLQCTKMLTGNEPSQSCFDRALHNAEKLLGMAEFPADEFLETYTPIVNSEGSAFDGLLFETYGSDLAQVKNYPPECVWTYTDSLKGNEPVLLAGMRLINPIGYVITEEPHGYYQTASQIVLPYQTEA